MDFEEVDAELARARADLERIGAGTDPGDDVRFQVLRTALLGPTSAWQTARRALAELPAEERPTAGRRVNDARKEIEACLEAAAARLAASRQRAIDAEDRVDLSLPGRNVEVGTRHLVAQVADEVIDIMCGLGYTPVDGPEVESEYYDFTALNIPPDHPARSEKDTLYVDRGDLAKPEQVLLRSQTSPMQIRAMERQAPPVYITCAGKTFRRDTYDATHLPVFHQMEGLAVDEGLTFADLRGTLAHFAREFFGREKRVRFRPGHFPFTEPSAEMEVSWGDGWLEILGCGMVHPNVLRFVGIDTERYTGFAWGMGLDRLALLRHGFDDLRYLPEGDLRFLQQWGGPVGVPTFRGADATDPGRRPHAEPPPHGSFWEGSGP